MPLLQGPGAHHLIASLGRRERACGVVCASAGNHAQGVAYACRAFGIAGRIYLPTTTPEQKRQRVADLVGGAASSVITGDDFEGA